MKYIPAEKLIAEIKRLKGLLIRGACSAQVEMETNCKDEAYNEVLSFITYLQQEQPETEMKSPFTGGKVTILSREEEVTFRGEKVKIARKYYRCVDTGREFTDSKLDDDMMWDTFRAYCEKKGITSFTDIVLKQEQPDFDDVDPKHLVHTHYHKVRDTKTGRVFFAEYSSEAAEWYEKGNGRPYSSAYVEIVQEQPEVDLKIEIGHWLDSLDDKYCSFVEQYSWQDIKETARHFYELGLKARKEK